MDKGNLEKDNYENDSIQKVSLENLSKLQEIQKFDIFIDILVQAVEKYGKEILEEFDCAA